MLMLSKGLLDQSVTEFKFELDGKTYYGKHTGILAYRKDKVAFATNGSKLFIDDIEIDLDYI